MCIIQFVNLDTIDIFGQIILCCRDLSCALQDIQQHPWPAQERGAELPPVRIHWYLCVQVQIQMIWTDKDIDRYTQKPHTYTHIYSQIKLASLLLKTHDIKPKFNTLIVVSISSRSVISPRNIISPEFSAQAPVQVLSFPHR